MAPGTKPVVSFDPKTLVISVDPIEGAKSFSVWARHEDKTSYFECTKFSAEDATKGIPLWKLKTSRTPGVGKYEICVMAEGSTTVTQEGTAPMELQIEDIVRILKQILDATPTSASTNPQELKKEPPVVTEFQLSAPANLKWKHITGAEFELSLVKIADNAEVFKTTISGRSFTTIYPLITEGKLSTNVPYRLSIRANTGAGFGPATNLDVYFDGQQILAGPVPPRPQQKLPQPAQQVATAAVKREPVQIPNPPRPAQVPNVQASTGTSQTKPAEAKTAEPPQTPKGAAAVPDDVQKLMGRADELIRKADQMLSASNTSQGEVNALRQELANTKKIIDEKPWDAALEPIGKLVKAMAKRLDEMAKAEGEKPEAAKSTGATTDKKMWKPLSIAAGIILLILLGWYAWSHRPHGSDLSDLRTEAIRQTAELESLRQQLTTPPQPAESSVGFSGSGNAGNIGNVIVSASSNVDIKIYGIGTNAIVAPTNPPASVTTGNVEMVPLETPPAGATPVAYSGTTLIIREKVPVPVIEERQPEVVIEKPQPMLVSYTEPAPVQPAPAPYVYDQNLYLPSVYHYGPSWDSGFVYNNGFSWGPVTGGVAIDGGWTYGSWSPGFWPYRSREDRFLYKHNVRNLGNARYSQAQHYQAGFDNRGHWGGGNRGGGRSGGYHR